MQSFLVGVVLSPQTGGEVIIIIILY
jgi:hypothetical protein